MALLPGRPRQQNSESVREQFLAPFDPAYKVNWTMLGALGEIVGAFAVVASLLYVAKQVRYSAHQTQVHNRREASQIFLAAVDHLASDEQTASIYARGTQDFEGLTEVERVRFSALFSRIFTGLEEAYYAQLAGEYPDWSESDSRRTLAWMVSQPGVRQWWAFRKSVSSDQFGAHVDQQLPADGIGLAP